MENSYFDLFEDTTKMKSMQRFIKETPRSEVKDVFFIGGTRHEAVVPFGEEHVDIPREPKCHAKQYKFELDTFQKISVAAIERDESVLVSAHTSCGKTVVAEYAIALSLANKQRVVYTSPIKALSNQKFRELQEEFKDVGLMTGDVTINPDASCLVMTTEILRNMLYRGSEVIREVHWIIFDEIHYMRDKERGVVWEEAIILLPKHVRMVFLSATIPNALEFAEWISYIQSQTVHVVYTENRVIPLTHYFQTDNTYLIKDKQFHLKQFNSAMQNIPERREMDKVLKEVMEKVNVPAVVFSFSRKECENLAVKVKRDFLNSEEKEMVKTIFENAISSLRAEDRLIPVVGKILPLLQRGIGIHHSGLLPIIREVVEILFQESLVKVLFATETFSIGLNMPAKTVIFTSLKKFDGTTKRLLTSGEFIQMSGRAGRRGIDESGVVVSILTEELTVEQVKRLFSTTSDKLYSAFRLTYNMVLNLMRVEGLDPMYILSRSFFHFQAYKNAIEQENKISTVSYVPPTSLSDLLLKRQELWNRRNHALSATFRDLISQKSRVVDLMIPRMGSILLIKNAIVKCVNDDSVSVYVLTNKDIEFKTFPIKYVSAVYDIKCKQEIKVFSMKFRPIEYYDEIDKEIAKIEANILAMAPEVDFESCLFCKKTSRSCLVGCIYMPSANFTLDQSIEHLRYLCEEEDLQDKIEYFQKLKEIYHMDECKKMVQVLRTLEYIDETSVLIKGKMASEISAGDELVITEMIFNSDFINLPLIDIVALISCCVCEEKNDDFVLSEENDRSFEILVKAASRVTQVMNSCGIDVSEEKFLNKFSSNLMDIVKMWLSGKTFSEICESTNVFEGSIIRCFKRLEELLRQLTSAAAVIGNTKLVDLFSQGIFLIKRDIIFANSLYL